MPIYTYECPECGLTSPLQSRIKWRDRVACHKCSLFHDKTILMRRLPDAPNFVVKGFNAKGGYSK